MRILKEKFGESPLMPRVLPFFLFLVLTSAQAWFGESGRYWLYLAKTVAGVWLIYEMRPHVAEMRWAFSWEAVVAGVGVFGIWVGLDPVVPKLVKGGTPWNPLEQFSGVAGLGWGFVVVRVLGSSLVVPPLEEVFYRSFLYRYLIRGDFHTEPLGTFNLFAFVASCLVFGLVHPDQWLSGILCGVVYQGLVCRKKRLGDAMTAHAITNFLLGLWVVGKSQWHFW